MGEVMNLIEELNRKIEKLIKGQKDLQKENEGLSNSVTELTNTKTELENKVTELTKQIEKLKEILSFEEYREQFQKGKRTLLGKTIKEWLIYQNESEELKKQLVRTKEEKDFFKKDVQELEQENAELKAELEKEKIRSMNIQKICFDSCL